MILEGLQNFGGGGFELPEHPPRYATAFIIVRYAQKE